MSKEHLKPFRKGDPRASECGKKSRRRGIDERLREMAQKYIDKKLASGNIVKITIADAIDAVLLEKAKGGDLKAIEMYYDRVYKKAVQPSQSEIDVKNPVIIMTPEEKKVAEGK